MPIHNSADAECNYKATQYVHDLDTLTYELETLNMEQNVERNIFCMQLGKRKLKQKTLDWHY